MSIHQFLIYSRHLHTRLLRESLFQILVTFHQNAARRSLHFHVTTLPGRKQQTCSSKFVMTSTHLCVKATKSTKTSFGNGIKNGIRWRFGVGTLYGDRLTVPFSPVSQVFWAQHFPSIAKLGEGHTSSFKGCLLCPSEHHTERVCPLRSQMFFPDHLLSSDSSRQSFKAPERRERLRPRYSRNNNQRTSHPGPRQTGGRNHSTSPSPTSICDFFNLPRGCKKSRCDYSHVCARCKSKDHSAPNCKQ